MRSVDRTMNSEKSGFQPQPETWLSLNGPSGIRTPKIMSFKLLIFQNFFVFGVICTDFYRTQ